MINELIFFVQTIIVAGFVLGALRLGREALVTCVTLLYVTANIFVVKQVTLFGFDVTCADVYIIGAVLASNLIQEYFGRDLAEKTIWISFFISLMFLVMSQVHLQYFPNPYDVTQNSFLNILGLLPRIVVASFIAYISSQYFRLFLYSFFKRIFSNNLFARNLFTTLIEQALDTVVFGFIGLYGVVHAMTDVFVVSYSIKILAILLTIPWVLLARKVIR